LATPAAPGLGADGLARTATRPECWQRLPLGRL